MLHLHYEVGETFCRKKYSTLGGAAIWSIFSRKFTGTKRCDGPILQWKIVQQNWHITSLSKLIWRKSWTACKMDTWWNFRWMPRCFSKSFLVKAFSRRPSINCSSNTCEYWGSPQSLIHRCATHVWSTKPHLGYLLQRVVQTIADSIALSDRFNQSKFHTKRRTSLDQRLQTYFWDGSFCSSMANLSFLLCKGFWIFNAESSSESLKPIRTWCKWKN